MSAAIDHLKTHRKWVAWKYKQRGNGKPTKPPINPFTGQIASIANPEHWGSYEEALAYAQSHGLPGVGYVLTPDDNITGADLDHVIDPQSGELVEWAAKIVALNETYCEISPSGTGLRFFWLGKIDHAVKNDAQQVEIYCDGRYLTVTCNKWPGSSDTIQHAPRTLEALLERANIRAPEEEAAEQQDREEDNELSRLNSAALQNLAAWVPDLYGTAARVTARGVYRVSSAALGRDLQEDLSISPTGIVDFGVHDMGDSRRGKRSPLSLVMEERHITLDESIGWLCERLGVQRPGIILDPADPIKSARALMKARFLTEFGLPVLHRHRGSFWAWRFNYFRPVEDEALRTSIWRFLENVRKVTDKGIRPFKPKRSHVGDILDALNAVCQVDPFVTTPTWLTSIDMPPAHEFMACNNGLLHIPSGRMFTSTPDFFGTAATDVIFDEDAPKPDKWLTFLDQVLGDDEAITTLQDWMGYTLTPDTSQQKILLCYGPPRSGKGTIARIHRAVLGNDAVVGPTMAQLSENFGLEPLIPSPLAIISDARIGGRTDKSIVIERLLSISGEDSMTVQRKFKQAWTGRLPTRFAIMTNELPSFSEGSGALARRFIMLIFQQSFLGREDTGLEGKLRKELSGILNWAIEGYRRLHERGHFVQPRNAGEYIEQVEMLGAPVKAFLRDRCMVGPQYQVSVDELYEKWKSWSTIEGRRDPGTKEWFGRNLHSALPGLQTVRRGQERERYYTGVAVMDGNANHGNDHVPF